MSCPGCGERVLNEGKRFLYLVAIVIHSGGSRVGDLLDAQNVKGHVIETQEHAGEL